MIIPDENKSEIKTIYQKSSRSKSNSEGLSNNIYMNLNYSF
jgi:hypothetical protein